MPAQNSQKADKNKAYSHVYNKGTEERNLFVDEEDYKVFLGYLKDYLTVPADPDSTKKTFTVNERTFRGIPHQPKNYFDKVELVAFSLCPGHFHLLINEKESGSLEKFLRSLSTRYAIYYNKKYKRTGSLFIGPYKSVKIKDSSELLHLTRYFHLEFLQAKGAAYSSYLEYTGEIVSSWVNPKVILSYFKGKNDYKNFVENYELKDEEKEVLERIIIESVPEELEKRDLELENASLKAGDSQPASEPRLKFPAFIAASALMFVLLLSLGIRNINTSVAKTKNAISSFPSPTPSPTPLASGDDTSTIVLGEEDLEYETMVVIKIDDGAESVNIRAEPSTKSEILGKAKDGETFEFVSEQKSWYKIKFNEETFAFVSKSYAQKEREDER